MTIEEVTWAPYMQAAEIILFAEAKIISHEIIDNSHESLRYQYAAMKKYGRRLGPDNLSLMMVVRAF